MLQEVNYSRCCGASKRPPIFGTEALLPPATRTVACWPLSASFLLSQAPHLLWKQPTAQDWLMWGPIVPGPSPQSETSLKVYPSSGVTSGMVWGPYCDSMMGILLSLPIRCHYPTSLLQTSLQLRAYFMGNLTYKGTSTCMMMEEILYIFLLLTKIGRKY